MDVSMDSSLSQLYYSSQRQVEAKVMYIKAEPRPDYPYSSLSTIQSWIQQSLVFGATESDMIRMEQMLQDLASRSG